PVSYAHVKRDMCGLEIFCTLKVQIGVNAHTHKHIHYRSKVWGHPDNFVFSMKTHTFMYQMSCKMNSKYSQDIDKVRNNDFYLKFLFCSSNFAFVKECSIYSNYSIADLWHS